MRTKELKKRKSERLEVVVTRCHPKLSPNKKVKYDAQRDARVLLKTLVLLNSQKNKYFVAVKKTKPQSTFTQWQ